MSYAIISAPFFYSHLQPKLCVKTPTTLTLELEEDKPSKKKKAHCLLEFGKPVRNELKMLTFLKTRPGCWENWSSPLQARPKVNWGVTEGGGSPWRGRKLLSNETQHCFANPAHLPATTQPQHSPWRFTQLLPDWLREVSVKVPSVKKTLAACQHYKTNYGARRLSRFKVPSPFKTEWSKQAVGFCF